MTIDLDQSTEQRGPRRRGVLKSVAVVVALVIAGFIPGAVLGERHGEETAGIGIVTPAAGELARDSGGVYWTWTVANFSRDAAEITAIDVDGKPTSVNTRVIVGHGITMIRIPLRCQSRSAQLVLTYVVDNQTNGFGDMVTPDDLAHTCNAPTN